MKEFAGKEKRILILIEDGSFLFDNRVKREAFTLVKAGYQICVICPRYPGESSHDIYEGICVYRYTKWLFGGHLTEYLSSLLKGGFLSIRVWKEHRGFDCIQACNPPDLWFIIAFFFKAIFGVKFVFDHHDVCPELYLSRFNSSERSLGFKTMLFLERLSFKLADGVISTNESYRKIAIDRGNVPANNVMVVRNGPDLEKFRATRPDPEIVSKGRVVVGYLGNMNPQDGVDHLLRAADKIVNTAGRKNFYFVFIGKGDSFGDLTNMKTSLGLDDYVLFTGRIPDEDMLQYLCSCDICVQPDPKNPLNDISTMNKVMEYMALGKAVVAYDLVETRFSGGDCILYATANNVDDLADKIIELAENEKMRTEMGDKGRRRVEDVLAWEHSEKNLLAIYEKVFSK